jgi:hypothetical protein
MFKILWSSLSLIESCILITQRANDMNAGRNVQKSKQFVVRNYGILCSVSFEYFDNSQGRSGEV